MNKHSSFKRQVAIGVTVVAAALCFAANGGANAPAGHFTVANGVVTDTLTGLKWQQTLSDSTFTFSQAFSYCDSLVYGGSSAWRVPSGNELITIVDYTQSDPAAEPTAFPNTPTTNFWTSSFVNESSTTYGYWVDFQFGESGYYAEGNSIRVRCVQ